MSAERVFLAIGLCAAFAFAFLTPPFQVPDEVGHFWRAESIAYGYIVPPMTPKGPVVTLPDGDLWLVNVFWRDTAGHPGVKITWQQFRSAAYVSVHADRPVRTGVPAGSTPVPYAPQVAAALAGRLFHLIPPVTFYAGRLFNALAYLGIIAAAIRMTPNFKWLLAATALLPMALYLAASWSPDAMTTAAVFFFLAAILRARRNPSSRDLARIAVAGVVVGLCKPYFLVALLVFAIPASWRSRLGILAATAFAAGLSMWSAARAFVPSRPDAHVDAAAQIACIRANPMIFVDALATELRVRGAGYAEQAAGRLGLLDVHLPWPVIWAEWLLVVVAAYAVSGELRVGSRIRAIAALVTIATVSGIFVALYTTWTPVCAHFVDGVQGRYFLPIVPLALLVISAPLVRERIVAWGLIAVAAAGNAVALGAVVSRYYL